VAEGVREVEIVGVVLEIGDQGHASVPDLQVVSTRHVGHRRPPRVLCVPAVSPVGRAVGYAVKAASGRAPGGTLCGVAREGASRVARALPGTEGRLVGAETGVEQYAIG